MAWRHGICVRWFQASVECFEAVEGRCGGIEAEAGEVRQVEMAENTWIREMLLTMPSKPEYIGEPDAVKVARPVRWGIVGKVPA